MYAIRCAGDDSGSEDDRLLLAVRKPRLVNSTFDSLTVGRLLDTSVLPYFC